MTADHCADCDSTVCPGFTTPRATPEPLPPPRPERVASDSVRKAHVAAAKAAVDDVRRNLKGGSK